MLGCWVRVELLGDEWVAFPELARRMGEADAKTQLCGSSPLEAAMWRCALPLTKGVCE